MKYLLEQERLRPELVQRVEAISGQDVRECYQCAKCSAGCPIAADMDLQPNQVMRLLQVGLGELALRSGTIWLCASCETCTTRCPREVDLAAVMDALRNLALREGIRSPERTVTFFNRTFLRLIKTYGRVFEMELIARFNVGTLQFLKDVPKAPKLLFKGRLKLWPSFAGRKTARSVFKDIEALEAGSVPEQSGASDEPAASGSHVEAQSGGGE